MKGSITIGWGKYGGFYFIRGFSTRICLGWISFTYFPDEIDNLL